MDTLKKNNIFSVCTVIGFVFMISGCSTVGKQDKLLELQKRRIVKLEKALRVKDRQLAKLKGKKWASLSQKRAAVARLDKLMAQKKWVEALKLSTDLKTKNPKSLKIARSRHRIFKAMGLKKQARGEMQLYRRLKQAKKKSKQVRRL